MNEELHFHFVCTREEAREIIDQHNRFWVSNCGCREGRSGCKRSRMDLCLFFDTQMGGTGSNFREVVGRSVRRRPEEMDGGPGSPGRDESGGGGCCRRGRQVGLRLVPGRLAPEAADRRGGAPDRRCGRHDVAAARRTRAGNPLARVFFGVLPVSGQIR